MGERDPARLYEQALIIFGIVDLSKLLISVGDPPHPSQRFGHAHSVIIEKKVMLERLGKVSGWVGTGFALLAFVFAFMKWSPGHGEPFYFGLLAAVLFFLIGQAVRYVLVARSSM
jgi:hypothetical protein